ncbi:MAG: hypothetical protein H7249_09400 [Chitinophagaceae bacterium]|nr:hypothetical protein [Oligoflexus sp.]
MKMMRGGADVEDAYFQFTGLTSWVLPPSDKRRKESEKLKYDGATDYFLSVQQAFAVELVELRKAALWTSFPGKGYDDANASLFTKPDISDHAYHRVMRNNLHIDALNALN